jgi:hypothetical protein
MVASSVLLTLTEARLFIADKDGPVKKNGRPDRRVIKLSRYRDCPNPKPPRQAFVVRLEAKDFHEKLRTFRRRLEGGGGPISANKNGGPEVDRCVVY